MKPQLSRSLYYQRAERHLFHCRMGFGEAGPRVGLTGETLQRVLNRTYSKDDKRIAKEYCERIEHEIR